MHVESNLGDGGVDVISFVNVHNVSLNGSIASLRTFPESFSNASRASLENLRAISVLSVLVFEDFVSNEVFVIFGNFVSVRSLNEVVARRVELCLSSNFHIVHNSF